MRDDRFLHVEIFSKRVATGRTSDGQRPCRSLYRCAEIHKVVRTTLLHMEGHVRRKCLVFSHLYVRRNLKTI